MTTFDRTYSLALDIELVNTGSDYEGCRSQMRDELERKINRSLYSHDYKTEYSGSERTGHKKLSLWGA